MGLGSPFTLDSEPPGCLQLGSFTDSVHHQKYKTTAFSHIVGLLLSPPVGDRFTPSKKAQGFKKAQGLRGKQFLKAEKI